MTIPHAINIRTGFSLQQTSKAAFVQVVRELRL